MRNGRSPRRFVPGALYVVATSVFVAGCQRPLLQQSDALPVSSQVRAEHPVTAEVPSLEGTRFASAADAGPAPARAALPPVPTPLLDAIAARASSEKQVDITALSVAEAEPAQKATAPPETVPATPVSAPSSTAEVIEVPSSEAPPVAARRARPGSGDVVIEVPSSEAPPVAGPETKIVRDQPPREAQQAKTEPPDPRVLWRDGLKPLRDLARDEAGKNAEGGDWAIRLALLDWLSGGTDRTAGLPWRAVLAPLARAAEGSSAEDPALASELHAAVESLDTLAPLEIRSIELCRRVRGFGAFDPIEPNACKAGRAVIVYCELAGVRYEPDGDHFRSRVSSQVELRPIAGGAAVWSRELGVADDSCRRRRRDYYVNYRLDLPEDLAPGNYELRLTQTDLLSHQAASRTTTLAVVP